MKLTDETHHTFPTLESLVGTTWGYQGYSGGLKYVLRVTGVGTFEWIVFGGSNSDREIGRTLKLYSPADLDSYRRVITTPEDPHVETDF